MASLQERDARFELYIALRRLRTEMWRSFPLMMFVRWMFNRHPRMVVPFALCLGLAMLSVIALDGS